MAQASSGDLRILANGLFPAGGDVKELTPEGRDEVRDAVDVILKLWDTGSARLGLALERLDKAADEIERLKAALKQISDGAENQDIDHREFRIKARHCADGVLHED